MAKTTKAAKPEAAEKPDWKNRIVGHAEVAPTSLVPNNKNFRNHPTFQKTAMRGVLDDVGWIQEIIVNKTSGKLIDGHLRLDLALKKKSKTVPVKYVELTEEEERLVMLTFDPVGDYAHTDNKRLRNLMRGLEEQSTALGESLAQFLEHEADQLGVVVDGLDTKADAGDTDTDTDGDKAPTTTVKDVSVTKSDSRNELSMLSTYMPDFPSIDIGVGPCSHSCVYCFTKSSRAALSWKGMRPKTDEAVISVVDKASRTQRILQVGASNDPSIPQYIQPLRVLLREAIAKKVYLLFHTKDPAYFLGLMDEFKFPPEQATFRTSFAGCNDDLLSRIEPGVPTIKERVRGLQALRTVGFDTQFRLSPLILGEYDGIDQFLKSLKFCTLFSVEPLRINKTAEGNFFSTLNGLVRPDWNIAAYYEKWGRQGVYATDGPAHWYNYNPDLLEAEFVKIKTAGAKYGLKFSLGNYDYTWQHCHLSDVKFEFDSPAVRRWVTKIDPDTLMAMTVEGRIETLRCDYLRKFRPGTKEFELAVQKIIDANRQDKLPLTKYGSSR